MGRSVPELLGEPLRVVAGRTRHDAYRTLSLPVDVFPAFRMTENGVATITAELDAASGIRLLSRSHAADDREKACWHARALLAGIDPTTRPLAALQARLLLVETSPPRGGRPTRETTSR